MLPKLITRINSFLEYVNALMLLIITVCVLIAVFGRYLFRAPMPAAMEAAYFAMLWCAFIMTGKALYDEKHIGMAFLQDRLKPKPNALVNIIINSVVMFTAVLLGWYSALNTIEAFKFNWYASGSLEVPKGCLYGVMALGSFYLGFIAIYKIYEHAKLLLRNNDGD